ncbi:MAG TPA: hypothetical protein VNG33_13245 [Polyangiaceae bacterium]|nr:hypothetical protein [Polyangiaceae bacterium]
MAEQLTLALGQLLYRTRGHDWDYAFLLQPEPLLSEGWYTLHRRIFANVEPGPTPVLLRGALGVGLGHPFLATAFTDAKRSDYQARPVAHYIAWLGKAAEEAPGCSFGPGLVDALAVALDAIFGLDPEALKRGETKALDTLLRARFQAALGPRREVTVTCASTSALRWLGTIAP